MLKAVSRPEKGGPIRIGRVFFDPSTGEIRGARSERASPRRLPPQPARLLELLVEKRGALATHDEIRQLLWPDTHVDFEQSMSFCVRQIRAVLRDAGGEPEYVETLPRRGYRLREEALRTDVSSAPTRRVGWRRPALAAAAALLVATAAVVLVSTQASAPLPRLAIMPFELAAGDAGLAADAGVARDLAGISERLLVEAARRWPERLEVIGPRSTAAYSSFPFPDLRALGRDLDIDYVLNARFLERDGEIQLIVELIRLADGAHPWARFFLLADGGDEIVQTTLTGIADGLELGDT